VLNKKCTGDNNNLITSLTIFPIVKLKLLTVLIPEPSGARRPAKGRI
jgi:hypothetical protein